MDRQDFHFSWLMIGPVLTLLDDIARDRVSHIVERRDTNDVIKAFDSGGEKNSTSEHNKRIYGNSISLMHYIIAM